MLNPPQNRSRAFTALIPGLSALVLFWLLMVALQHWERAPQAPFNGYPDEPSHYISGLMIRDYAASGFSHTPIAFAEDYYLHLPYFAIGYWPPVFYAIEAAWVGCFGAARGTVLMLIALLSALIAMVLFLALRPLVGTIAAFGFGVLFLLLPVVMSNAMLVMTDIPVALFSLGALLALEIYLRTEKATALVLFAVITSVTVLTKASGLYLAAVLPVSLIATGRWRWFFHRSFWLAPLTVVLLCAPWYLISRRFVERGLLTRTELDTGLGVLGWTTIGNLGLLAPLAAWGAWKALRSRPMSLLAAICVIQLVVLIVFLMVAPVFVEPRYMIPALAPLVLLAGLGFHFLVKSAHLGRGASILAIAVLLAAAGLRSFIEASPAPENGIRAVAEFVVRHGPQPYRTVMVSPDAEGPMTAEIVQSEADRTALYLLRPSKLLARMDWLGQNYRERYENADEVQALLNRVPIDLLILPSNPGLRALPHERLLEQTIRDFPAQWRRVYPPDGRNSAYEAYEPTHRISMDPEQLRQVLKTELRLPGGWMPVPERSRNDP